MSTTLSSQSPGVRVRTSPGKQDTDRGGGSLHRYARLLDLLGEAQGGLSFTELARGSALPRGTVHRLLRALAGVGFVEHDAASKLYTLGPRLLRLLHLGTPDEVIETRARAVLADLVARFEETAFVALLRGDRVETVAMLTPPSEQRSYVHPGRVMPLHATASAKAIFAWQDEALVDRFLSSPPVHYTEHTRTDPSVIKRELDEVRRTGFAVCAEELDPGVYSYACPVRMSGAGVIYSVGLVGLSQRIHRFTAQNIIGELEAAAGRLAQDFGASWHGNDPA